MRQIYRETLPSPAATVLVADDDAHVLRFVADLMGCWGYRVLPAQGGPEALSLAEANAGPIDLLVTDIEMPGINGVTLWHHLRERYPTMKAIFISGYTPSWNLDRDVPFVMKPFIARRTAAGSGRGVCRNPAPAKMTEAPQAPEDQAATGSRVGGRQLAELVVSHPRGRFRFPAGPELVVGNAHGGDIGLRADHAAGGHQFSVGRCRPAARASTPPPSPSSPPAAFLRW